MKKIWLISNNKGGKTKMFKTEQSILSHINSYHKKYKVTIFQEVESYDNAFEYKEGVIKGREREEGLKILLDSESTIQLIYKFKEELSDKHPTANLVIRNKFKILGNSVAAFKKIISESEIRQLLLYRSRTDVEWYKLLLQIHNFRFDENRKWQDNDDKNLRTENFKKAKEDLKKEKKV